jgi:hypothetical protein
VARLKNEVQHRYAPELRALGYPEVSDRVFGSYDDILDHCCFAWNQLIDQRWKIMPIGARDRAYR